LYGGEAGVHFHPHPLDWLHITSSFESVIGKQSNNYLPLIPANKWNSVLKIDFKNGKNIKDSYLSFNTEYNLQQNKISAFETPTQDYLLIHCSAGTQVNFKTVSIDFFVSANNVFNKNYVSHLSRLKPDGIANMGRNVVFGMIANL
jgi:iron complex outermembrane receptor protein